MSKGDGVTYKDAGVDIDAGTRAVELMKRHVRSTFNSSVLQDIGSFGAMFQLDDLPAGYIPVFVSSADGVGTKLKLAFMTGRHNTVGQDLVNHCVNDILVQGARALFFLDYFATGKLDPLVAEQVVQGLSIACKEAGCALIGGETAEMPDMYTADEYDLAGFIVGIANKSMLVTGSNIRPGCKVIGIGSNGMHTNGYSLARKIIFEIMGMKPGDKFPWGTMVADELLRIHRSYAPSVLPLMKQGVVLGAAHITGGGIPGNLVRVLPEGCHADIDAGTWEAPPIFTWLQEVGNIPIRDKERTFNDGLGYTLVVDSQIAENVVGSLRSSGEQAWIVGNITMGERSVEIHY